MQAGMGVVTAAPQNEVLAVEEVGRVCLVTFHWRETWQGGKNGPSPLPTTALQLLQPAYRCMP